MDMDYQEGYNDGLAGIGMQDRDVVLVEAYELGFLDGSLDRKEMLREQR